MPDEDRSNIKQPTQLKYLNPNKISKPLWIEISKDDFMSLIKDVDDNLDNKDYKTKTGDNHYNFRNGKKCFARNNHQKH